MFTEDLPVTLTIMVLSTVVVFGLLVYSVVQYKRGRKKTDPQDPFIFHYHDGTRERTADPLSIEQSLTESLGEDWRAKVTALSKPLPKGLMGDAEDNAYAARKKARKEVLDAIDKAFDTDDYVGIGGLDEHGNVITKPSGLIEPFRFGLLEGYQRFCLDLIRAAHPFEKRQPRASPTTESPMPQSAPVSTSVDTASPETATTH